MNRFELAQQLISAPWLRRLTDRSFLMAIAAAALGFYLYNGGGITGSQFVELLQWTLAPWIVAEKAKDALIGQAAVKQPEPAPTAAVANVAGGAAGVAEAPAAEQIAPDAYEENANIEEIHADNQA